TRHAPLYVAALRPLIAAGEVRRVLVAGAADYGLLAVVFDAFRREGVEPQVTVADRCATPLRLCRWYAERFGVPVRTVQRDIAALHDGSVHDAICAHSLLSCVPVGRHANIAASWYGALRPGGL